MKKLIPLLSPAMFIPFAAIAQETVTSSNGKYYADARMAVPAVLKKFGYRCPVLERKRGITIQVSADGKNVQVISPDGLSKTFPVKPNYRNWKRRSIACLRGKIEEDGKPVRFALCAKLKGGYGKNPEDWRSKGVFMAKSGTKKKVNIGDCR